MSKKHKQLKSPWNNLQSAIWLIGIAILFLTGDWWPGILFVIAISILAETALQLAVPSAFEEETPPPVAEPAPAEPLPQTVLPAAAPEPQPAIPNYRTDLLPASCPSCGARVRTNEVRWISERTADCAYCGSPLITSQ